jgi:hypothetical protein
VDGHSTKRLYHVGVTSVLQPPKKAKAPTQVGRERDVVAAVPGRRVARAADRCVGSTASDEDDNDDSARGGGGLAAAAGGGRQGRTAPRKASALVTALRVDGSSRGAPHGARSTSHCPRPAPYSARK